MWTCGACGAVLDRDINAAVNVAKAAAPAVTARAAQRRRNPLDTAALNSAVGGNLPLHGERMSSERRAWSGADATRALSEHGQTKGDSGAHLTKLSLGADSLAQGADLGWNLVSRRCGEGGMATHAVGVAGRRQEPAHGPCWATLT
ncbi:hypothetical protein ACF097_23460 [Streptomyces flaveolus]|uniref:hypothetical protein n=1 Tax=Streptomyces flaveolus TaxID=67297 RepID=UPI003700EF45